MRQATLIWSTWQRLLQPFASAFTRPGHRRFVEWVTALVLNVEERTITQSVTNNGMATNQADTGISVGNIGGVGASVRASAAGSIAAISLTSINSGAPTSIANVPIAGGFGFGPIVQTSINSAPVLNSASITSSGTVTGIGSSVAINATGAAASFSVASIADTTAPTSG